MLKKLIIIGAGGMGREVLQWIKDINLVSPTWEVLGFVDDNLNALDSKECDYQVIGTIHELTVSDDVFYALAVASCKAKESIVTDLKSKGAKFATIIHPSVRIGSFNHIGEGAIIYPNASLSVNCEIGNFVTLLGSTVGHDAKIGDFSSIMGTCNINGGVEIGRRVFLGCQTVTVPGRKIGDDAYICAGSIVMTNIRKNTKVMGNPAKRIEI